MDTIVASQSKPGEKHGTGEFTLSSFTYDATTDSYTCPAGQVLGRKRKPDSKTQRYYNKAACRACEHRGLCASGKAKDTRILRCRENSAVLDRADARYQQNAELYKLRQQIIEHLFGTAKRTMGGYYLLLRSKPKVAAEVALAIYRIQLQAGTCGTRL